MNEYANEDKALEAALAGLKPSTSLDRDRLIFMSGLASAPRNETPQRNWFWPASCALSTTVALGLTVALLVQGQSGQQRAAQSIVTVRVLKDALKRTEDALAEVRAKSPPSSEIQMSAVVANDAATTKDADDAAAIRRYFEQRQLALANKPLPVTESKGSQAAAWSPVSSREQLLWELLPEAIPRTLHSRLGWSLF